MKFSWKKLNKPILALAPMAGITDSAFRQLCRSFGSDVVYTEMTSIDALHYGSEKTIKMLKFKPKEQPIIIQLFGKQPELVKKAVELVEQAGFDGIDLNFGCPARKVVAHEGGVTLLRNLNLAHEIVQAVCEATKLPVSVKTRTSINNKNKKGKITVLDFIDKIKDLPVKALMLHGRSYEQGFSREVDFEIIKETKRKFKGIVLGNGGLNTPEDIKAMLDKTKVDGVGLARGLYGKPWFFKQVGDYLQTGKYKSLTLNQIKKIALKHAKLLYKEKGQQGMFEIRKHLTWYFKSFPHASEWRKKLVLVESIKELEKILAKIK